MANTHVKYLLIGGGLASSSAAQAIRERDPSGSTLLVGQEVNRPYDRRPMSADYLLGRTTRNELFTLDEAWFATHDVALRTRVRVTRLDPARQVAILDTGDEITYDKALLATGATPNILRIPGADLPNVHYLRTLEQADRLHNAIEKALSEGRKHMRGRGRVTIIGGGTLGVELATALLQLGLAVDLVVSRGFPWPRYVGECTGRFFTRLLEARGIRVHVNTVVQRLDGDGRVQRVVLPNGPLLETDFVVVAIGVTPNKDLLRGTAITAEQAVLVDDHGRTNNSAVYAAGDCAAIYDSRFDKYRMLCLWNGAQATGRLAGLNMAGGDEKYDTLSGFTSTIIDVPVAVWGAARAVDHRLQRGQQSVDAPDFADIGVGSDQRVAQVIAVGNATEDPTLPELVRRRAMVDDREQELKDLRTNLGNI